MSSGSSGSSATSTGPAASKLPKAGPPKNRMAYYAAAAVLGVGGYYLYTSGGDPNAAKKAIENDATRASAEARDQLSGSGNKFQNSAQETLGRVGGTIDSTVQDGKARINESEQKLREAKDQTGGAVMSKIDEADRKIETEASKAKSGLFSWFGGGK
ncbi:hypothetical protein RUND412_009691 [Rhizina undulata]